jgi:hypothetical protein
MSFYIHKENINAVWHKIEPILRKSCDRINSGYQPEHLKEEIEKGHRQLWFCEEKEKKGVGITHISQRPTLKIGVMAVGGGDLEMMDRLLPEIEYFFRINGCQSMELIGRKGWMRHMSKYGYAPKYYYTAKEI